MNPEQIVKVNVPLVGTYEGKEIDEKNRMILPKALRDIYQLRQRKDSFEECVLFASAINGIPTGSESLDEHPLFAKITDSPQIDTQNYYLVSISSQGRILFTKTHFEAPKNRRVDIIGRGDSLELRIPYQRS